MQLDQQQLLPVSQQQAWDALNDVSLLQRAIPGCESITPAEHLVYDLAMTASVGPVRARFKGKLRLMDLQSPTSYRLQFEGNGGAAGHGQGSAVVTLESQGMTATLLAYSVDAKVGGKIAQIGSRLVDMAAQKMAKEFFENFEALLEERYPTAPAPVVEEVQAVPVRARLESAPSPWERLRRWVRAKFSTQVI